MAKNRQTADIIKSANIKILRLMLLGRLSKNLALRSARPVDIIALTLCDLDEANGSIDMTNNCFIQALIFEALYFYQITSNCYSRRHNYNDSCTYLVIPAVHHLR